MSLRKKVLLLAGTFALIVFAVLLLANLVVKPEPVYEGKSLSDWLKLWREERFHSGKYSGHPDQEAALRASERAVRAIGEEGIPFLLQSLRCRNSGFKVELRNRIPARWQRTLHLAPGPFDSQMPGLDGFHILGPAGKPALPALIELAGSRHPDVRRQAISALGALGPAGEPAIPLLINCLTNDDWQTRQYAAMSLCAIHQQPHVVIPALVRYLEFLKTLPLTAEDVYCVNSLRAFGTNAKPAVPLMLELLQSTNEHKRSAVTNSLPLIDPEAARRAGITTP
jgi:hypothetical protein